MNLELFQSYKKQIQEYLDNFLFAKKNSLAFLKPWGEDVIEKIKLFSSNGKMIRGGLILLMQEILQSNNKADAIKAAAAMELIQTALLIHDDIMDRDTTRRGEKTIFFQYKESGDLNQISDSYHFGEGMGICAGDIGFFLAFEILSELEIELPSYKKLLSLFSKELTLVGIGQMQDLYFGSVSGNISEEAIYQVYTHKTARYTFSLPLMIGAQIAKSSPEIQNHLSQLGEAMGIIFQIRDDELGLFGNEKEIGKPIGADIKEEKKTLYYYFLFNQSNTEDRQIMKTIFGNKSVTEKQIQWVKNKVIEYGIQNLIEEKVQLLAKNCREIIEKLNLKEEYSRSLTFLLDYNLKRKK